MPWELDELLDPALVAEGLRRLAPLSHIAAALHAGRPLGDFDRVAALETALYMRNQLLRDADWAGMAHGGGDPRALRRSVLPRRPAVRATFWRAINAKDAVADVPAAAAAGGRPRPAQDRLRDAGRPLAARGRRRAGRRRGGFLRCLAQLGAARLAERLDGAGGGLTPDDRPHPGPGRRRLRRARRHRALQPRPVRRAGLGRRGDPRACRGLAMRRASRCLPACASGRRSSAGCASRWSRCGRPGAIGRSMSCSAAMSSWRRSPWLLARLLGARYWLQAHGTEIWSDRRSVGAPRDRGGRPGDHGQPRHAPAAARLGRPRRPSGCACCPTRSTSASRPDRHRRRCASAWSSGPARSC